MARAACSQEPNRYYKAKGETELSRQTQRNAASHQPNSRRVHAVGSYGFANFGDDLFVDTIKSHASVLWPGADVRTLIPTPLQSHYSAFHLGGKLFRLAIAAFGVMWADTIALCGGSILQDSSGVSQWRRRFLSRRRVEALGVSVGPFADSEAEARVKGVLGGVDKLVVRDMASVLRVQAMTGQMPQVFLGGDLVALHPKIREVPHAQREVVTICLSAAADIEADLIVAQLQSAVATLSNTWGVSPRLQLLALSSHPRFDDIELSNDVATRLGELGPPVPVVAYRELGIEATCDLIARSRLVITQRLHGGIVAYLSGVPFIMVGHHAKIQDFCSDIGAPAGSVLPAETVWDEELQEALPSLGDYALDPIEYRARACRAYLNAL